MKKRRMKRGEAFVGINRRGSQLSAEIVSKCLNQGIGGTEGGRDSAREGSGTHLRRQNIMVLEDGVSGSRPYAVDIMLSILCRRTFGTCGAVMILIWAMRWKSEEETSWLMAFGRAICCRPPMGKSPFQDVLELSRSTGATARR